MINRAWLKCVIEGARLILLLRQDSWTRSQDVSASQILERAGTRSPRSEAERLMLLGVTADVNNRRAMASRSTMDSAMGTVMPFIRTNSRDAVLTRSSAARALGMSESWLAHSLKRTTGKSFTDHLNEARLADAQRLLRFSEHSVKHVALTVGLRSESALSKLFKRGLGMSPSAWRQQARRAQGAGRRKEA